MKYIQQFTPLLLLSTLTAFPTFASEGEIKGQALSSIEPMKFSLEIKSGDDVIEEIQVASIAGEPARVEQWHSQDVILAETNTDEVVSQNIKSGFEFELNPSLKNGDVVSVYVRYRESPTAKLKKGSTKLFDVEQDVWSFSGTVILSEGSTFCSDSGEQEKVTEFCISRQN
ncbi:hypothetical protein [Vibrio europaeus]|uniref:hypothetical protein n=1 Tax=Vibrio europaeus TaxID=300876 RepID=UPI00233E7BEF|nr:hypothetical protein [Vibrio europaeus]MDC5711170.1 hypothetical protein [Vibrio europaeus]MDC5713199.1 hypothetical protein [Vibrio europaeus]